MKKIAILMSTYNGQEYIKDQLNSILNQQDVKLYLYIRDDGSGDNTVEIIKQYMSKHDNIFLYTGNNIGYKKSFMELVYMVDEFDYYAFADQDDIWESNKIKEAIKKLECYNEPALYYSMMTQVDKEMNIMEEQQKPKSPLSKEMVLFQNFVQGSTIVFNNPLHSILLKYRPEFDISHDIWIPCVATYLGKVIFDERSFIKYRRHESAVTEIMKKPYCKNIIEKEIKKEKVDNMAIYLLDGYENMLSNRDKELLKKVAFYDKKIGNLLYCLINKKIRKYTIKGSILLKLSFICGRIEKINV